MVNQIHEKKEQKGKKKKIIKLLLQQIQSSDIQLTVFTPVNIKLNTLMWELVQPFSQQENLIKNFLRFSTRMKCQNIDTLFQILIKK